MDYLVESIQNLTEALNTASHVNVSDWILIVITLAYVIATIVICIFNVRLTKAAKKQANVATKQFEEIRVIQKQNVDIQLFEKRHEIFVIVRDWNDIAHKTFNSDLTNPSTGDKRPPHKVFMKLVFDSYEFERLPAMPDLPYQSSPDMAFLDDVKGYLNYLRRLRDVIQDAITTDNSYVLERCVENPEKELERYSELIHRFSESLELMKSQRLKLELAKYVYFDIDIEKLSCFVDTFFETVNGRIIGHYVDKLRLAHLDFESAEILAKMEEDLKLTEKKFSYNLRALATE